MQILTKTQIQQKIARLAFEILENNFEEKELILAGINFNGMTFAGMLRDALLKITKIPVQLIQIRLNPAKPLQDPVVIDVDVEQLKGKAIIIVDDVANTGRTIFYAVRPLMEIVPSKIEVAVLVDRKHKSFPIAVDYVGISLATTIQEDIDVRIRDTKAWAVHIH
ncbi:MAG TPA: phosphoribosyltransferase family protein [Saprospiraceae bacterium]|nr:phosphoribosyltransferase family protein [Saprospiraceae bacterium]